jgi:glycosyltransferase involved in cell wall biosynthesis
VKIGFAHDLIYAYASKNPEAVGGAERQQWLLARALAAEGFSIVVAVHRLLKLSQRRTIDGVEFTGIGQSHLLLGWKRFLQLEQPDWWYLRGADHLLGPAVEIAKLTKVRTIFSTAFDNDVHPSQALPRRQRWWPLYAWGLERAERIFVQHVGQLSLIAPHWRSKTFIIPSIAPIAASITGHYDRKRYVAWVAMLRQPKRPDLLVEIARKAPGISFVVCGEPTVHRSPRGYGEQIVQSLQTLPNVDYRGRVSPAEAQQVIAEASAFLLTSEEEGFPNTLLQAWASGTPIVSLRVDPGQVISQEELGFVTGDTENAVQALRALIGSPRLCREIAFRARRHVLRAHGEATVTKAFERALHSYGPDHEALTG